MVRGFSHEKQRNNNNNNNNNNHKAYQPRPPGPARDEKKVTSPPATRTGYCLWCTPAPAGREQRHPPAEAAHLPLRREGRNVHYAPPHGRDATTRTGRAPQPKPWKQPRKSTKENPYASPTYCRNPNNPPKATRKRLLRGRTSSDREVLQSPSLPPRKACTRGAAVVHGSGRAEQQPDSSSDVEFLADEKSRVSEQQDGDGCGYTVPGDFFCSWECAGRWNAMFSPVQARHERGIRIDIAAGRVVTR